MSEASLPEVWMRGPIESVPAVLQPAVHALLHAREEVTALALTIPEKIIWLRPGGAASIAFHLQHMKGVLDRLFTYADGKMLNEEQLEYLRNEGKMVSTEISVEDLITAFNQQIDHAITALKSIDENTLTDFRGVGRKQLPSTVIGLLFHAAEHTMRHLGQLLVTVKVLKNSDESH